MATQLPEGIEADRRVRPRGLYGNLKTWLFRTRNLRNLDMLVAAIAVAGVVVLTIVLVRNESAARRASEVADIAFDANVAAYNLAIADRAQVIADRALCLDSVDRSDANRDQWSQLADRIEGFQSDVALALAADIRSGPVLSRPPRQESDCPVVPPLPEPPTR